MEATRHPKLDCQPLYSSSDEAGDVDDEEEKIEQDLVINNNDTSKAINVEAYLKLPEPNPLQKRKLPSREKLRIIYKYAYRDLIKFKGREIVGRTFVEDLTPSERVSNPLGRDTFGEKRTNKEIKENIEERTVPEKLMNYFKDEDKLVFKRSQKTYNPYDFNSSKYNLKKYILEGIANNQKNNQQLASAAQSNTNTQSANSDKNATNNDLFDEFKDCYYQPKGPSDETLVFESRFESGNLSMVSKVSDEEYNLIMQNDINTYGYGQWFFFEVRNTRKGKKAKFNILNYIKTDSLFNQGMKVLIYSIKDYQKNAIGWVRGGKNLTFEVNHIQRENRPDKFYRTFSFEYEFQYDYDRVFFAYSHPYTYTDLCDFLDKIESDETKSNCFLRSTLCRTIAGNKCELLTITNNRSPGDCDHKRCIVLTGRVHPGETNSSFMMQGVIEFLVSDAPEAEKLRNQFIFKIIPMLNPDGVIHGNYRCDLAGRDLNRVWRNPSEFLYPTIYHTRRLMFELHNRYKIAFYCDFHGHSKNYTMSKYKKGAARITVHDQLHVPLSYTLEASFFGSDKTKMHFSSENLIDFGHKFCKALALFYTGHSTKGHKDPDAELRASYLKELYTDPRNIVMEDDDLGSDSQPSEDELPEEVIHKFVPKVDKKGMLKPRSTQKKKTTSLPISPKRSQKVLPKETLVTPVIKKEPSKPNLAMQKANSTVISPTDREPASSAEENKRSRQQLKSTIELHKKIPSETNLDRLKVPVLLPLRPVKDKTAQNGENPSVGEISSYQLQLNTRINKRGEVRMVLEKHTLYPARIDLNQNKKLPELTRRDYSESALKSRPQNSDTIEEPRIRRSVEPREKRQDIRKKRVFQPSIITMIDQGRSEIPGNKNPYCVTSNNYHPKQSESRLIEALERLMNKQNGEEDKSHIPPSLIESNNVPARDYYSVETRSMVPKKGLVRYEPLYFDQDSPQQPRRSLIGMRSSTVTKSMHSLLKRRGLEKEREFPGSMRSTVLNSEKSFREDQVIGNYMKQSHSFISISARKLA